MKCFLHVIAGTSKLFSTRSVCRRYCVVFDLFIGLLAKRSGLEHRGLANTSLNARVCCATSLFSCMHALHELSGEALRPLRRVDRDASFSKLDSRRQYVHRPRASKTPPRSSLATSPQRAFSFFNGRSVYSKATSSW